MSTAPVGVYPVNEQEIRGSAVQLTETAAWSYNGSAGTVVEWWRLRVNNSIIRRRFLRVNRQDDVVTVKVMMATMKVVMVMMKIMELRKQGLQE